MVVVSTERSLLPGPVVAEVPDMALRSVVRRENGRGDDDDDDDDNDVAPAAWLMMLSKEPKVY